MQYISASGMQIYVQAEIHVLAGRKRQAGRHAKIHAGRQIYVQAGRQPGRDSCMQAGRVMCRKAGGKKNS